jgi:transposase InsO family protein
MAVTAEKPQAELVIHSDRGIQYASQKYRSFLQRNQFVGSMSTKGDCWDNAGAESFFSTLKTELIHRNRYESRDLARRDIFEFIEAFYNRERLHSALGYRTPSEFGRAIA